MYFKGNLVLQVPFLPSKTLMFYQMTLKIKRIMQGVIIGAGGFWLAFRTAPAWGPVAGFWVMNLAGTALAYLLTMRRKFLESNLGRE